ncbi:hypothetical protein BuS5_02470 [Desulfosarcina sp. BuS5]|uniref:hypothetical protein n=1 Tax=Desulfosarcina sp. BuS5 TaxID=933262 RepID=UPI0004815AFD|nr:hypothetical protein [Desulfosarcina sp. BuS5]WDN89502.1 hypothetical protein BuS5_02470 [Desulfosarcina sp. BuS5]
MKTKSKWHLIISVVLVCAFLFAPFAWSEEKEIVVDGAAPVSGENIEGARNNAVKDALRKAVEQGVGTLMDADSILQDDLLMEKIYTSARGYITGYKIIKERREQNGLYRVKIRAVVKPGILVDTLIKLGLYKCMMDYPRILVICSPDAQVTDAAGAAESVFLKTLTSKHFDLVDPGISLKLHDDTKSLLKADTINNAAAKLGLEHHAEIVLLYGVKAKPAGFDGMMETASVTMRVKAIVTTTAQILFADEQSISGIGESADIACLNGARRAAENIASPMINGIVSWWADYTANGLPYTIRLKTGKNADRLVFAFQDAVESIPRVVSLTERSSAGGITEMMVKYKGTVSEFKRAIFKRLARDKRFTSLQTEGSKGRFLALTAEG